MDRSAVVTSHKRATRLIRYRSTVFHRRYSFEQREVAPAAQNDWTTRALTGSLWKEGVPEFSLLWLSEPDRIWQATGLGENTELPCDRGERRARKSRSGKERHGLLRLSG